MEVLQQREDHLLVDTDTGVSRLEVIEGPTGRRTWPDDVKARIVTESFEEGVRVCDVARRHGLAAQHLSTWRRLARRGKLPLQVDDDQCFAALIVDDTPTPIAATSAPLPAQIEIEVAGVFVRLPEESPAERIAEIGAALRPGSVTS